ncbi:MAG: fluoride efflux transporter CrcB [Bacteroidales bacterium]|nr:fluoride efflux transporter CrcB [Bacteroidales bacterium]
MTKIILLLVGGAIGTLARYALSGLTRYHLDGTFPYGTLAVNLTGSLVIGLIWGLWETTSISINIRTFMFIGILGGFTTFSTYALETINLFRSGEEKMAVINILANNILGLLLVFLGFIAAKGLLSIIR